VLVADKRGVTEALFVWLWRGAEGLFSLCCLWPVPGLSPLPPDSTLSYLIDVSMFISVWSTLRLFLLPKMMSSEDGSSSSENHSLPRRLQVGGPPPVAYSALMSTVILSFVAAGMSLGRT